MKQIIFGAFAATFILLFFAVRSQPEAWNIDTEGVEIKWDIPEEPGGESGTIGGLEAEIRFDDEDLAGSHISASVTTESLESNNKLKTKHLKGKGYFDAKNFPQISFASSELAATESGFEAIGKLTFKEKEVDVRVPFSYEGNKKKGKFIAEMWLHTENDLGIEVNLKSSKDEAIEKNLQVMIEIPVKK